MANIRTLVQHTFIYGFTSVAGKSINYLLVPIHTYALGAATGQYGIMTRLYAATALLSLLLTFGMETALFRFLNKDDEDKERVYSTIITFSGIFTALFALGVIVFNKQVATLLDYEDMYLGVMAIFLTISFDAFQSIPLAYIRQTNRPYKYMAVYISKIIIIVLLNFLYFIALPKLHINPFGLYNQNFNLDISYTFYINLVGSIFSTILLFPEIRVARFHIDKQIFKKLFNYCWPLVLLGIAGQINKSADKLMYPYLDTTPNSAVNLSIYGGVVKIAAIMTMITQAFRNAYEPLVFGNIKDKSNKEYQAKAMKYYLIFMLLAFLIVLAFLNIIRYLVGSSYWDGLYIVPIIMTTEILFGIYYNLSMWYKTIDQTYWGAWFSGFACFIYLGFNILFVPIYGYVACAIAGLAAYSIATLLSYFIGQRKNPINYPMREISYYVILAGILTTGILLSNKYLSTIVALLTNFVLLSLFITYLFKHDFNVPELLASLKKQKEKNIA